MFLFSNSKYLGALDSYSFTLSSAAEAVDAPWPRAHKVVFYNAPPIPVEADFQVLDTRLEKVFYFTRAQLIAYDTERDQYVFKTFGALDRGEYLLYRIRAALGAAHV